MQFADLVECQERVRPNLFGHYVLWYEYSDLFGIYIVFLQLFVYRCYGLVVAVDGDDVGDVDGFVVGVLFDVLSFFLLVIRGIEGGRCVYVVMGYFVLDEIYLMLHQLVCYEDWSFDLEFERDVGEWGLVVLVGQEVEEILVFFFQVELVVVFVLVILVFFGEGDMGRVHYGYVIFYLVEQFDVDQL